MSTREMETSITAPEKDSVKCGPWEAKTYYVKHENGWWGCFTVCPAIGLLQVHSDFGTWSNRWDQPGEDFRQFLLGCSRSYISSKFGAWARMTTRPTSRAAERHLMNWLDSLMTHLWPLFINQLEAELAMPSGEVSS